MPRVVSYGYLIFLPRDGFMESLSVSILKEFHQKTCQKLQKFENWLCAQTKNDLIQLETEIRIFWDVFAAVHYVR